MLCTIKLFHRWDRYHYYNNLGVFHIAWGWGCYDTDQQTKGPVHSPDVLRIIRLTSVSITYSDKDVKLDVPTAM